MLIASRCDVNTSVVFKLFLEPCQVYVLVSPLILNLMNRALYVYKPSILLC